MSNEIAKSEPGFNLQALVDRAASDPNFNIDVLQKMLDFQERLMDKQAEINFNAAMGRLQEKLPRIKRVGSVAYKDKDNGGAMKEAFKFARYEDIDGAIRPFLLEEGFSLSFDTKWSDAGAVIYGTLTHREGHSRTVEMRLPLDASGGKNNLQGMGSTISYGKRYAVGMLLNIITVGEDNDGADEEKIEAKAAETIVNLLTETKSDMAAFKKFMGVEKIEDIYKRDFQKAITALNAKKVKQK